MGGPNDPGNIGTFIGARMGPDWRLCVKECWDGNVTLVCMRPATAADSETHLTSENLNSECWLAFSNHNVALLLFQCVRLKRKLEVAYWWTFIPAMRRDRCV